VTRRVRESAFQAMVMELASLLQWASAHFHDSRREVRPGVFVGDRDAQGFPDLVLARDRVVFAELKRQGERPRAEQTDWLNALARAGEETYLWTLDDLDEISAVLGHRWAYDRGRQVLLRREPGATVELAPASMWLLDGRRDRFALNERRTA